MSSRRGTTPVPARPAPLPQWRKRATCTDDPSPDRWVDLPDIRVRGNNNPDYDAHLQTLAQVCDTCPVRDHCLWESLTMNVRGVFAGTDEFDRADLRETLGLPTPPRMPAPENDEDARLIEQQFTALRLARKNYTNNEIAEALGVSAMTVSRLTASEDRPAHRRSRATTGAQADTHTLATPKAPATPEEPKGPVSPVIAMRPSRTTAPAFKEHALAEFEAFRETTPSVTQPDLSVRTTTRPKTRTHLRLVPTTG